MAPDLRQLLDARPVTASIEDYRLAIMDDNVLGRTTASTRRWTFKKLRELYGLDPTQAVFRCFRQLWEADVAGRPLLAMLCASARDPLLRMSAPAVLQAPLGSIVTSTELAKAVEMGAAGRFSPKTLRSMGGNLLASWTQSGHLAGARVRRRARPIVSVEAMAYALVLGRLSGFRGPLLFSNPWAALLDSPTDDLYDLAAAASRRGWIDLRRAASVVEVRFSRLLTPVEEEVLRESD